MLPSHAVGGLVRSVEALGRHTVRGLEELGYGARLLAESLAWSVAGPFQGQPVRMRHVLQRMRLVGVQATPIVVGLAFVVGAMLAMQGIHTLRSFGAESQVVVGIALGVTREFGPMITGILVAGRSGSALAAEIGTMRVTQEVDALQVIGIDPVRQLVAPALLAMLVMLPCLTVLADLFGLLGGAAYTAWELGLPVSVYLQQSIEALVVDDVRQGLLKSIVFAFIITMVGAANGFTVTGGAEGVGHATTRAVVQSIAYILLADMVFTFILTR